MNYEWTKDTCDRWETLNDDVGLSWIDSDDPYHGTTVFLDGYYTPATLRRVADDVDELLATGST